MQIISLVVLYDIIVCQISTIHIWAKSVWWRLFVDCEDLDVKVKRTIVTESTVSLRVGYNRGQLSSREALQYYPHYRKDTMTVMSLYTPY
jgi:hypothetical protein